MKSKLIKDTTTSRGEFNRAYKFYLEHNGKISCTYCKYHRNENGKGRGYYSGQYDSDDILDVRYPNWKLASSNKKQWMKKPIKVIIEQRIQHNRKYVYFKFPACGE